MDDYNIKYNDIFEKLVININQNDTQSFFSGMLAYSMYKQEKHEWAESYRKMHNTNNIPLSDLNNFLLIYSDEYLLRLKNSAELYTEIAIDLANPDSNYSKLIHFIIGGKEFVIQQVN